MLVTCPECSNKVSEGADTCWLFTTWAQAGLAEDRETIVQQ